MKSSLKWMALAASLVWLAAGCTTTVRYGDATSSKPLSTDFGSADLQQIVAKMVDSMLSSDATAEITATRRPVLIVDSVKNKTMQHIDTESITDSIRTRLIRSRKFSFQDRTTEKALTEELAYQQVASEKPVAYGQQTAAEYMLTSNLSEIEQSAGRVKDVYYKFTMSLRNLKTGELEWADEQEIRKEKIRSVFGG
ncbi:MAG: penicillin-binding protein activator LpoB [Verrucomicrobiota bacterium]|jgi:uncharacterized protein (TIGR02722 family)|nr:penicillin-binding protein activator LpoB [Verrucomicrobiota bacterium]